VAQAGAGASRQKVKREFSNLFEARLARGFVVHVARRSLAVLAGTLFLLMSGGASAAIHAYEGFIYERRQGHAGTEIPGEGIDGLNGGTGWNGPWSTTSSDNLKSGIPAGPGDYGAGEDWGIALGARVAPLAYIDIFGNRLVTRGNQIRTSFGLRSWERRQLAVPIGELGGTVWISFLAQAHGQAGTSRYAFVELFNGDTEFVYLGNVTPVSTGNWGLQVSGTAAGIRHADAGADYPMDVPTMFLAKLEFPETSDGPIRISLWLNPRNLVHEKALLAPIVALETPCTLYTHVGVAGRYSTDFDELRIGTTFDAVTPTREIPWADAALTIERTEENLSLSWPLEGTGGFVFHTSHNLVTWTRAAVQPAQENGQNRITLPVTAAEGFFRLQYAPPENPRPRLPTLEALDWESHEVRRGLVYYERHLTNLFGGPQVVNVLAVDLDDAGVRLELTANDVWGLTRTPVPQLAEHAGAIAAINGGFAPARTFPEVGYGIMKFRGIVWPFVNDPSFNDTYEAHGRNAVGIDANGEWHFASRGAQGWEVGARWPEDWPGMVDAMAGGSQLVRDGRVHPLVMSNTTQGAYLTDSALNGLTFKRHPRTAIGITPERVAVLATVAGRFPGIADGMTLHEMAELMLFFGCRDALELDGGGSTTMWIGQAPFSGVVNYPTDNGLFDHQGARSLRLAVLVMAADGEPNRASKSSASAP
jgi:hypothetical protein